MSRKRRAFYFGWTASNHALSNSAPVVPTGNRRQYSRVIPTIASRSTEIGDDRSFHRQRETAGSSSGCTTLQPKRGCILYTGRLGKEEEKESQEIIIRNLYLLVSKVCRLV